MNEFGRKKACPCRNCGDRKVGCHGKCEKYISWAADHEKKKMEERSRKVYVSHGWGYIPRKKRRSG